MKVKHSIGTGDDSPPEGHATWINFWDENNLNEIPKVCPQCGKRSKEIVGAHVEDENGTKYILPVCDSCNLSAKRASSIGEGFRPLEKFLNIKLSQNNFFHVNDKLLVELE